MVRSRRVLVDVSVGEGRRDLIEGRRDDMVEFRHENAEIRHLSKERPDHTLYISSIDVPFSVVECGDHVIAGEDACLRV